MQWKAKSTNKAKNWEKQQRPTNCSEIHVIIINQDILIHPQHTQVGAGERWVVECCKLEMGGWEIKSFASWGKKFFDRMRFNAKWEKWQKSKLQRFHSKTQTETFSFMQKKTHRHSALIIVHHVGFFFIYSPYTNSQTVRCREERLLKSFRFGCDKQRKAAGRFAGMCLCKKIRSAI